MKRVANSKLVDLGPLLYLWPNSVSNLIPTMNRTVKGQLERVGFLGEVVDGQPLDDGPGSVLRINILGHLV